MRRPEIRSRSACFFQKVFRKWISILSTGSDPNRNSILFFPENPDTARQFRLIRLILGATALRSVLRKSSSPGSRTDAADAPMNAPNSRIFPFP